jgi:hypothetical protein
MANNKEKNNTVNEENQLVADEAGNEIKETTGAAVEIYDEDDNIDLHDTPKKKKRLKKNKKELMKKLKKDIKKEKIEEKLSVMKFYQKEIHKI